MPNEWPVKYEGQPCAVLLNQLKLNQVHVESVCERNTGLILKSRLNPIYYRVHFNKITPKMSKLCAWG